MKFMVLAVLLSLPIASVQAWPGQTQVKKLGKMLAAIPKKLKFWGKRDKIKLNLSASNNGGTIKVYIRKKKSIFSKVKSLLTRSVSKIAVLFNYITSKNRLFFKPNNKLRNKEYLNIQKV